VYKSLKCLIFSRVTEVCGYVTFYVKLLRVREADFRRIFMEATHRQIILIVFQVLFFSQVFGQDTTTIDFYDRIKAYDYSVIIAPDSIVIEDLEGWEEKIECGEILGFIGDDYHRFFIHFISVIQNPINPYEYFVYGKTKVKDNVCSYQGTITVKQARIYKRGDIPGYTQGFVICDVILFEDKKQPSAGLIKGNLTSYFLIDYKGRFRYDAIAYASDGFSNNQFIGNWTSYTTNISKKCHWGDSRIPESGDLDIGAGEFSVNPKYVENGWANLALAWGSYPVTPEMLVARQKENEEWWK